MIFILSFERKYKKCFALDAGKNGEFVGNKLLDAVTKSKDDKTVKREPVEEIIIQLEKKMKY